MKSLVLLFVVCLALTTSALGQTVCQDSVEARLKRAALTDKAYQSEIDLSAGKLPLGEVFRCIAGVNGVNLCVKVEEGPVVTCNFDKVKVVDLLLFLCREYRLGVELSGNILSVYSVPPAIPAPREPSVSTDSCGKCLSYDLLNDDLAEVARRITHLTGIHLIVPQALYGRQVSGYCTEMPVEEAISLLAAANNLDIRREKKGVWMVEAITGKDGSIPLERKRRNYAAGEITVDSARRITLTLPQGNVQEVVEEVCERLGINRLFLIPLDRRVSVFVRKVDLATMLDILFAGTAFTYRVEDGVYLFGTTEKEFTLLTTRVIPLRYRTVDRVIDLIPDGLKTGMQIRLFAEQNSVIASGTSRQVKQIVRFLETIDRNVPLITIEVLIVDSKKSRIMEAGITAGLGGGPEKTTGIISPGVAMSLTSASINKLINSFNGFGSINLGKVTPDFYMSLKALEEDGIIELRSTPKLSTLNGHEAILKSGEKKYYKEVQNNIYGTQNPIQSEAYTWKDVEANLSLKITPLVSREGKITLNVEIEQSEFTEREEKDAPPGTVTRSFKSQVLVCDGEMVLLGGIDRNSREKSSAGLPFISRVPVLKWIFGSTKDNRVDEKLNVFIKPNVMY